MEEIKSNKDQIEERKQKVFQAFDYFFQTCFVKRNLQKIKEKISDDVYVTGISKDDKSYDKRRFLKIISDKKDNFYHIEEYKIEQFCCTCKQNCFFECYGTIMIRKTQGSKASCHYKVGYGASFLEVNGEMKLSTLFLSEAYLELDFFLQLYEDQLLGNIESKKEYNTIQNLFVDILNDALRDPLTGVYNRKTGEREIKKILKLKTSYLFLLMDIDGFKEVNDNYGHQDGDKILKYVVNLLQKSFRATDIIFRLGGDEFIIFVYPCDNLAAMQKKLDWINNEYEKMIEQYYMKSHSSLSFGGIYSDTSFENQFEKIYNISDEMLYKEKEKGGNGYVIKQIESK